MHVLKIVILGAAGVGKTSIVRQFALSEFSEEYTPTDRKSVYQPTVVLNERVYSMRLVDLPPIPYFPADSASEWADFRDCGLRSASAYILVFDLDDLESFHCVKSLRDQICDSMDTHGAPLFVVGNKLDTVARESREVAALVKKHWKCAFVECSARHNWHVATLFREVVRALDCAEAGQKISSPRFDTLHHHHHAHHHRDRGDSSVVKCAIM